MMILWSGDVSNWDSPAVEQNAGCLAATFTGPPVIRASLESLALKEIAIAQIDAFESRGRSTQAYAWAYGSDVAEQNAENTIALIDGHISLKRVWADIEDYSNFVRRYPGVPLPRRIRATLAANGFNPNRLPELIGPQYSLRSMPPAQAVAWLRAWVTEIRTLGYTPGFYSAPGVWNDLCGGDASFGDVDGWSATWNGSPNPKPPTLWAGITNWIGTQYLPGGNDATACGLSLDLNAWDADKLAIAPPVTPPGPPAQPPEGGPYALQSDLDRLNAVLAWRMDGLRAAANFYLDKSQIPPE